MNDYIAFSAYFGAALTLLVYLLAHRIGAKLHHPLANPMLICLVIMLILLLVLDIDYDAYNQSAQYITYLLTPATACLALPLYRQIQKLREYPLAIVAGIVTGGSGKCPVCAGGCSDIPAFQGRFCNAAAQIRNRRGGNAAGQ